MYKCGKMANPAELVDARGFRIKEDKPADSVGLMPPERGSERFSLKAKLIRAGFWVGGAIFTQYALLFGGITAINGVSQGRVSLENWLAPLPSASSTEGLMIQLFFVSSILPSILIGFAGGDKIYHKLFRR